MRKAVVVLVALSAAACGGLDGEADPFDALIPPAIPARTSRELRIVGPRALHVPAPHELLARDHRPRGPFLGDVVDRLYFVTSMDAPAPAERIDLRAIGTEEVELTFARLVDDAASPFGLGAADHFELTMPTNRIITPGRAVSLVVRFKADTMEMQNAFLEIQTTAQNLPFLRVALTGKVFQLP